MINVKEGITQILVEHLGVSPDKVQLGSDLMDDLGADSLDAIEAIMATEEKFGISFDDLEMDKVKTVQDMIQLVESKLKG